LSSVTIGNGVENIGSSAFISSNLTNVTLGNGLKTIGQAAFAYTKLTGINIPMGVTSIGSNAFLECRELESVVIPNSVETIGYMAFFRTYYGPNDKILHITIPESVKSIGDLVVERRAIIYGVPGSAAEIYAKSNQNTFVPIGDTKPQDPPKTELDQTGASAWAQEGITNAITAKLVPQNLQAKYTQATTRAEFAALAVQLYETITGKEITERQTFSDTSDINVEKAAAINVVSGVGDNKFSPDIELTREQAATMLARLADAVGKPLTKQAAAFADNSSISTWAIERVGQIQAAGVMGGVGSNTFDPQGAYTREQSIVTILRLYDVVK
jgi:hypothetical protein